MIRGDLSTCACTIKFNGLIYYHRTPPEWILTELYRRPSSLIAKYRPASVPWMTTTLLSTALIFKTADGRKKVGHQVKGNDAAAAKHTSDKNVVGSRSSMEGEK